MSKEKFELAFLAGGMLLDVLANRLRRDPATPKETIGAAAHAVGLAFDEHRDRLATPEVVAAQIATVRQLLCESEPRPLVIASYLAHLAELVDPVPELAEAVAELTEAVRGWLG